MKIRKQVYELSTSDLESFPVWEFALDEEGEDGQDEATVRPYEGSPPLDPSDGVFIVRARFDLADGTRLHGYLTPPGDGPSGVRTIQPIIVTTGGQVMFWFGAMAPSAASLEAAYDRLGRQQSAVFPVQYASEVELVTGPVRGELNGFLHYRSITDCTVEEAR